MPTPLTCLKVFIASPGGLPEERRAFRDELLDYNEAEAIPRGVLFRPIGWEDTLGAVGRPQSLINEELRQCDYFVLLLWSRWGSSPDVTTAGYSSGTEEEYHVALECFRDTKLPMRRLVLMFKAVDVQQMADPGAQLRSVLDFRARIEREKTHLFHTFDTTDRFQRLLRQHLGSWLRDEEAGTQPDAVVQSPGPPPPEIDRGGPVLDSTATKEPAQLLTANAWALADDGRLTDAEVEFSRLVVSHQLPEPLAEYGRFLARIGRVEQARVMFERSLEVATMQGDQPGIATARLGLGQLLASSGDLGGAEEMFREALAICETGEQSERLATAYAHLGSVLHIRGDLQGAEEMHCRSLALNERLGHQEGIARDYKSLGNVYFSQGDFDRAEQSYRASLERHEKLGGLEGMARAAGNLGNALHHRGNLEGAEEMHRKSLAIDQRLGRLEGIATTLGNLAILLSDRGKLAEAEKQYREALALYEKVGQLRGMADALAHLASISVRRGDADSAEALFRRALDCDQKLGRLEGIAACYQGLAAVLELRGDRAGAAEMLQKSLEIAERHGFNDRANVARQRLAGLRATSSTPSAATSEPTVDASRDDQPS